MIEERREIWRVDPGDLGSLRLEQEPFGRRPPGKVRIEVAAVGLNFADVFACLGLYDAAPRERFTPGLEIAGTVTDADDDAPFQPGERVMGVTRFGGYASRLDVDPQALQPLPEAWSMRDGAAFPVQAMTAWYALRRLGDLRAGQTVLVHSAAGGVGLQALAMIERLGGCAIGTVGSAHKVSFLQQHARLPGDRIIVREPRRAGDQLDAALAATGRAGFDLVLDSLGGEQLRSGYERLNPAGRLVVFGAGSLMPGGRRPTSPSLLWRYMTRPWIDPLEMIGSNRSIMGFNLIWLWERIHEMGELCREIRALDLPAPYVGERFPFSDAPSALKRFQSGGTVGKVILEL